MTLQQLTFGHFSVLFVDHTAIFFFACRDLFFDHAALYFLACHDFFLDNAMTYFSTMPPIFFDPAAKHSFWSHCLLFFDRGAIFAMPRYVFWQTAIYVLAMPRFFWQSHELFVCPCHNFFSSLPPFFSALQQPLFHHGAFLFRPGCNLFFDMPRFIFRPGRDLIFDYALSWFSRFDYFLTMPRLIFLTLPRLFSNLQQPLFRSQRVFSTRSQFSFWHAPI